MARHHLSGNSQADIAAVAGDVCGIQVQVASAAELALWARLPGVTRADISAALWKQRTLVKTYCMRQTLHWIPAADFSIYITALKSSRLAAVMRIASRFGVTQADVDGMNGAVMEALGAGALTRRELTTAIKPKVNKAVQAWMAKLWNPFRAASIAGLICYGPERGQEITFQRSDQWVRQQPSVSESEAREVLLRRYLRAYAPATLQDFAKWAGMPMNEVRSALQALQDELVEVDVEGGKALLLQKDLDPFMHSGFQQQVLRLLPSFDPYLLAHVDKSHLLHSRFYKRVYRNQGWISPVVMLNGEAIGTWSLQGGKRSRVEIKPFGKLSRALQARIAEEVARLNVFLETQCEVNFQS